MAYDCKRCGKSFAQIFNLKRHLGRVNPCDDDLGCKQTCEQLLTEMTIDRSDFEFECEHCEKRFEFKRNLAQHYLYCKKNAEIVPILTEDDADDIDDASLSEQQSQVADELLKLLQERLSSEEQLSFIDNFYIYLKQDPIKDFVIDLDNVHEWVGFNRKDNAKRVLVKNLKEGNDYKIALLQVEERSGHNKETILMTTNGFKQLCMSAATEKATRIRTYYIKMEEIMFEYLARRSNIPIVRDRKAPDVLVAQKLGLPPVLRLTNVGIPDALRAPGCVYVIFVGVEPETGMFVFKFGLTNDLPRRISEHMKSYACCVVVAVISLGMFSAQCAEDTIKWLLPVQQSITIVKIATSKDAEKAGTVNQETFACYEDDVDEVIRGICKEVSRIHSGKVRSVHYGHSVTDAAGAILDPLTLKPVQMLPPSSSMLSIESNEIETLLSVKQAPENWATPPSLEIEKERTKQCEIELEKVRAETEAKKAEAEVKQAEAKTKRFEMLMTMLDKHPEVSQHMDKLIGML